MNKFLLISSLMFSLKVHAEFFTVNAKRAIDSCVAGECIPFTGIYFDSISIELDQDLGKGWVSGSNWILSTFSSNHRWGIFLTVTKNDDIGACWVTPKINWAHEPELGYVQESSSKDISVRCSDLVQRKRLEHEEQIDPNKKHVGWIEIYQ